MIQLRLFRAGEPFQQIDERHLTEGEFVIGRDPSAHWMIVDESCELSRSHCTIKLRDGGAVLRDTSSNGVFLGNERKRAPRDSDVPLSAHETLHLGQFLIVLEPHADAPANDTTAFTTLFQTIVQAEALQVRSDWDVENEPTAANDHPPVTDAALLDAFCAGAGLDASSFMGEDPALVMRRAGAIYKQMVLGLGDLLSERHVVKSDLNMDRTTVGASGNNPFKWAPTRRVAIDLLREREDGFLSGATALKASFEDLKKHSLCLMAGSRASVDHVLRTLAPQMLENQITATGMLRLNKYETCWRTYQNAHAHLADEEPNGPQSSVNRAFKAGYERRLRDLDEGGTKS
ncbi:MAG: type VI secretion system-associated FHA domain protein TagH [Vitreimonas sp.]